MAAPQTHNASVQTLTVQIHVLRVGTKGVTLSAYRQLPERDIQDREGRLCSQDVWGWVSCSVHKSCPQVEHRHVLWSGKGELFRWTAPRVHPPKGLSGPAEEEHSRRYTNWCSVKSKPQIFIAV